MNTARKFPVAYLAAACLLAGSVVFAQVHQVQLGNPMDANPGINSGGSNQPISGFVPINGNDVITGNVSGLKYFHGTVGTTSPYSFQATLGSSNLNNFARQSAGGPVTSGAVSSLNQVYFLPSATVSTAQGGLYSAPIGSGFDSQLVPRISVSPVATTGELRALNLTEGNRAVDRATPAATLDPTAPGALLSNPLFVLRSTEVLQEGQNRPGGNLQPGAAAPLPGGAIGPNPANPANPAKSTDANSDTNTKPGPFDPVQGSAAPTDNRISSQTKEIRTASQSPDTPDQTVGSTYAKLMEELKTAEGEIATQVPESADNPDQSNTPGSTTYQIDPLTGRRRQIIPLYGRKQAPPDTTTTPPTTPGTLTPPIPGSPGASLNAPGNSLSRGPSPALRPGQMASLTPRRLEDLSTNTLTAGSKVAPVKIAPTPGGNLTPFDVMLNRGQTMLKDGRYMEAQQAYQTALSARSDDPLALVGRAHAELGAGLYASAASDLKFVYTRKPDMVALKYDSKSFIPDSRQTFLLDDLQKLTTSKEQGDLGSFLYCYLCYQTGRTGELKAELEKWGDRSGHDDWQTVLNRAWNPDGAKP